MALNNRLINYTNELKMKGLLYIIRQTNIYYYKIGVVQYSTFTYITYMLS